MKSTLFRILSLICLVTLLWVGSQVPAVRASALAQGTALDLTVTPPASEKSGAPNTIVTYTLNLKNTGNAHGDYSVKMSSSLPSWNAWSSAASVKLDPGASTTLTVSVAVPAEAILGASDITTVNFIPTPDSKVGSAVLTTRALPPTATPNTATSRPLVVLSSYNISPSAITPGQDFGLDLTLKNVGGGRATNLVLTYESPDFFPRDTGGVRAVAILDANQKVSLSQSMAASAGLVGRNVATLAVKIAYNDANGIAYSEAFTLTLNVTTAQTSGNWVAQPSATPTALVRPQLVVSGYRADVDPLQPGSMFTLEMDVRNLGTSDARAVTLVLGGGTVTTDPSGTPQPGGGLSGGAGDLSNFAPLGSSNLLFMGDIARAAGVRATYKLVVNVSINPGAYPLKLSFIYIDTKGNRIVDDQVITLLVYALPKVEVGFYRDPGLLLSGQPNLIPMQITNLGRKSSVLGNVKIAAAGAEMSNNISLVGALEPGGYFTLDAQVIPVQAGPLELSVTINYTDDFNQARTITQSLTVQVQEVPTMKPGMPGADGALPGVITTAPETFWQKVGRFFRGLFGLDSSTPEQPTPATTETIPSKNIPLPPRGKGG